MPRGRDRHDNNNHSHNQQRNYDPFVAQAIQIKNDTLAVPVGSFESVNWEQVRHLLSDFRSHPSAQKVPDRVEYLFDLMDRLCLEAESMTPQQRKRQRIRLPGGVFGNILTEWREWAMININHNRRDRNVLKHRKIQVPKVHNISLLSPEKIFHRVERYLDADLVDPSPKLYSIILNALKMLGNNQRIPPTAEEIFEQNLRRSQYDPRNELYHPNAFVIYEMIDIWTKSGYNDKPNPDAPVQAERHLAALKQWYNDTGRPDLRPNVRIYTGVMEAHSRSSPTEISFYRIQELFQEMKEVCVPEDLGFISYNRVCHSLASSRHPDSADAARAVLDEVCDLYYQDKDANSRFKPVTQHAFSDVMTAYGRTGRAREATEIFDRMEQMAAVEGIPSLRPDIVSYSSLIWAYAKAGNPEMTQNILARMMDTIDGNSVDNNLDSMDDIEKQNINNLQDVDLTSWESIFASWVQKRDPNAPLYITQILEQLAYLSQKRNLHYTFKTSTYNLLMSSYARQQTVDGARSAEVLFNWLREQEGDELKPDRDSFLHIIQGWINADDVERAEKTLFDFCDEAQEGKIDRDILDGQHFNIVINAWIGNKDKEVDETERARVVFNRMKTFGIEPDKVGYTSLLWAYAKSSKSKTDPAIQAERIFAQMEWQYENGGKKETVAPNRITYNALFHALARSADVDTLERATALFQESEERHGVRPDKLTCNVLMGAWIKCDRPDRAEDLYQILKQKFEENGQRDENMAPTPHIFSKRLEGWSKAGEPEQTQMVLKEWIDCTSDPDRNRWLISRKPGVHEFIPVLQAWLNSDRPNAAEKAEGGLYQMVDYAKSGRFNSQPTGYAFLIVISALAKPDAGPLAGERALKLLNLQLELGQNEEPSRRATLEPNLPTYTNVVTALCRQSVSPEATDVFLQEGSAMVRILLQDLQNKRNSSDFPDFFPNSRSLEVIGKLKQVLQYSAFPSQPELVAICRELESSLAGDFTNAMRF